MRKALVRLAQLAAVFAAGLWAGGRWCGATLNAPPVQPPVAIGATEEPGRPSDSERSDEPAIERRAAAEPERPAVRITTPAAGLPAEPPSIQAEAAGCHPRLSLEVPPPARSGRGTRKVHLELVNDCDDTVLSSWIDFDGREQNPSIVLPGTRMNVSTWETHVFRLRLGDRKRAFLRDIVAPAAARARLALCGCAGEGSPAAGGVAADGFEILDAGAGASNQPPVPECRVPFDPEPSSTTASSTLSPRYAMVFRNSCIGTRIRLDWVQFDGGLRFTGELNPGEQFDQTSFAGHQWRVRDATTGRWIRDFALDGGTTVDLCACE